VWATMRDQNQPMTLRAKCGCLAFIRIAVELRILHLCDEYTYICIYINIFIFRFLYYIYLIFDI
jgi:hypothetical protein